MSSISMRIHLVIYIQIWHCKWLPCHLVHSCICSGNDFITYCSISLWIPEYTPEFTVVSHQFWQDMFHMPCFCHRPNGSILILQGQVSRHTRWCMQNEKWIFLGTLSCKLAWKSVVWAVAPKYHCAWWQSIWLHQSADELVFKFRRPSCVSCTPGSPACLILQYQTTSSGAMSKARYMKHTLPKLMTQNMKFRSIFKGSLDNFYSMLWRCVQNDYSCVE
jgi:hypothetical protein